MKIYDYDGKSNLCGARIREKRRYQKLNQKEFAAQVEARFQIKLNQYIVCKIERGARFVPDYELSAIAKTLGVSMEELVEPNKDFG